MKIHSNLRRDSLLALLSLLLLHVGTSQAQSTSSFITIPVSFVLAATLMCICFWICFCVQLAKRRQLYGAPANVHYTPYVHNQRPYYGTIGLLNQQAPSYPAQRYVVPSTTSAVVNPPRTQQAYPRHGYISPSTGAVPSVSPLAHPGAIPQTTTSEPVSLPEATLHQGDAPPAYEEAVRMKTVDITDQDELQT